MKTKNFTVEELENYYNKNEVYFFNYRSCYILKHDKNKGFYFCLDKTRSKKSGLPHTKKGRFIAFKESSSYVVSTSLTPPAKIVINKFINRDILNGCLKAKTLINELIMFGFDSKHPVSESSLKDLSFKGIYLKSVNIKDNCFILSY